MCDFCEIFDFGRAKCDIDKYGASITFSGGSNRFPEYQQFNYCPKCGASRIEVLAKRQKNWDDSPIRHFIANQKN